MMRRDHAVLTALAAGGLLLTLFQCWYISLPLADASTFDICRFSESLNCFKSLHAFGEDLRAGFLPVIPLLCAVFLLQTALCGFAWVVTGKTHDAWLGVARLMSFPASGLAVYVLLHDFMAAEVTSVSAILVAILSLAISSLTVLHGLGNVKARHGWQISASVGVAALLATFLLDGAIGARRETDRLVHARTQALPRVRWPRFARFVPRHGAAGLGDDAAAAEVLLFVDPEQDASRALIREALALAPRYHADVRVTIYAAGEAGARLVQAQRNGSLAAHLADPTAKATKPPVPRDRALAARQELAWRRLELPELPAAVWVAGRRTGKVSLAEVLKAAKAP